MTSRAYWPMYVSVGAFATGVRLLYLAIASPVFTQYYWQASSSLLQNGSLALDGITTTTLEPLYPLFLAGARILAGERPWLVQTVQASVAGAGAALLYMLVLSLTQQRRAAIASSLMFAVYPLLVHHAIDATESALMTTLLIAFAYQFTAMRTTSGAFAAGAWLGLAILTRTVALPLLVLAPAIAYRTNRHMAAAMAAATILTLTPYGIRNLAVSGALLPARTGINLFIANSSYARSVITDYGPDILLPYAEATVASERFEEDAMTPALEEERDAAFRRLALAEVRQHPADTLRLKIENLYHFFSPLIVPFRIATDTTTIALEDNGRSIVTGSEGRPLRDHLGYTLPYCTMLLLAAIGIRRRGFDDRQDAILWAIVMTFAVVHAAFFPATRYRAPVEFVFLVYAGLGVSAMLERLRANHTPSTPSSATAA